MPIALAKFELLGRVGAGVHHAAAFLDGVAASEVISLHHIGELFGAEWNQAENLLLHLHIDPAGIDDPLNRTRDCPARLEHFLDLSRPHALGLDDHLSSGNPAHGGDYQTGKRRKYIREKADLLLRARS